MQEELEKPKSSVEEPNKPAESALTSDDKQGGIYKTTTLPPETTKVKPEDRAAKIERLKSGFTLCKPQGSFLWPNMTMSPQPSKALVHLEDLFLVPTPPSISSSSASSSSPQHLFSPLSKIWPLPNFPVKPLPERRPVTVTLTSVTKPTHPLPPETITQFGIITNTAVNTSPPTAKTSTIDLNELPCPHTYQRRNQNETTATNAIPFVCIA